MRISDWSSDVCSSDLNLSFDSARAFTTPRRLALVVAGLPAQQPDVVEEKKGPKQGAPAQAIDGFMKANGLASLDAAELRETDKGPFYFVVRRSEEHTSELQSLMRISYAVFCLKKKNGQKQQRRTDTNTQ